MAFAKWHFDETTTDRTKLGPESRLCPRHPGYRNHVAQHLGWSERRAVRVQGVREEGADIRPDFHWDKPPVAAMGYR
jgi:hypothetical protein